MTIKAAERTCSIQMTIEEGKNLIRLCLLKIDPKADIDRLILYKYGNRKSASSYQNEPITTTLNVADYTKLNSNQLYLVKCFIHTGIYVAWSQSVGRGNGKYEIYKREIVNAENDPNLYFKTVLIGKGKDEHAYIFREEKGICKFIREILLA